MSPESFELADTLTTFAGVDERRKDALLRAVSAATPQWSEGQRRAGAGLLDVLWNLPSYERLVGSWNVPETDATATITWLMAKVMATITDDDPPPPVA